MHVILAVIRILCYQPKSLPFSRARKSDEIWEWQFVEKPCPRTILKGDVYFGMSSYLKIQWTLLSVWRSSYMVTFEIKVFLSQKILWSPFDQIFSHFRYSKLFCRIAWACSVGASYFSDFSTFRFTWNPWNSSFLFCLNICLQMVISHNAMQSYKSRIKNKVHIDELRIHLLNTNCEYDPQTSSSPCEWCLFSPLLQRVKNSTVLYL